MHWRARAGLDAHGGARDGQKRENAPWPAPLATREPQQHRDDTGEQIGNEPEMATDEEIPCVVCEAVREVVKDIRGIGVVRALLESGPLPRLGGRSVEREHSAREGLSIASLIIEFTGVQRGDTEERARDRDKDGADNQAAHPSSPPPEPKDDQGGEQRVLDHILSLFGLTQAAHEGLELHLLVDHRIELALHPGGVP